MQLKLNLKKKNEKNVLLHHPIIIIESLTCYSIMVE